MDKVAVCVVFGLMLLALGGTLMFVRFKFLTGSKRTTATVSRISSRREESGDYHTVSTVYDSVLNFAAEDGTEFSFTHTTSALRLAVGDRVVVLYSPATESEPYAPRKTAEVRSILGEIAIWFAMGLAALFGLAILYLGWHLATSGAGR